MKMEQMIIRIEDITKTLREIFQKVHLSDQERSVLIDSLLDAEMRGIKSHGLNRVKAYYEKMVLGSITVPGRITKETDQKASSTLNGNNSLGQWCAHVSMKEAIEKAKNYGIGAVTVKNSNHFGAAGYFSKLATEDDRLRIFKCISSYSSLGGNSEDFWQ